MPFDAPFQLGPFSVAADGRLALADTTCAPRFHLAWQSRPVHASLTLPEAADDAEGWLRLEVVVGRVPSTVGGSGRNDPNDLRAGVFSTLRSLPTALPEGWDMQLLADHRVALSANIRLALPTSATTLLTDITLFLLRLGPYLDMLGEIGVEAPGPVTEVGMAKT